MTPPRRYGNRRIDRMLREWNDLRDAIRRADIEAIQNAFDACEEWVDFAFAPPEGVDDGPKSTDCGPHGRA